MKYISRKNVNSRKTRKKNEKFNKKPIFQFFIPNIFPNFHILI